MVTPYRLAIATPLTSFAIMLSLAFALGLSSPAAHADTNIALLATATASSSYKGYSPAAAIDGVVDGYPGDSSREWASNQGLAGTWLRLDWGGTGYLIDRVVIHDRPNVDDHILAATLSFSDGSTVTVGTPPNDGTGLEVTFAPRTVTSLRLTVDAVSAATENIGLAEIEVYGSPSGNSAPTAVAGADQTVAEGVTVQLDGSASSDPNGDTLTYQWTQIGGPAVTLSDITAVSPGFIAPSGLSANALLTFSLTVNDGELDSTPDTVAVNVQATTVTANNIAGLATATASSSYKGYSPAAAIDGVVDGYPGDSSREWASNQGLAGTWLRLDWGGTGYLIDRVVIHDRPNVDDHILAATLSFSDGSTVTVGTPPNDGTGLEVTFAPRTVTSLRLTVDAVSAATENIGLAEIEVYGSPSGNSAPTAVAGADQTVAEGVTVQLDGSASSDPNGDTLTYQWTQIGGPAVTLSDITAVSPGFIAPSGLSANALLTFSLTVNDGELDSTPDTVAVNVQATTVTANNIAGLATATASSSYKGYSPAAAIDGVVDGYPGDSSREWASNQGLAGTWLRLDWGGTGYLIDRVVIHDRPNVDDHILAATLSFSDGSTVTVGTPPNDGTGLEVTFAPRTVTSLRLTVDAVSAATENIGLAEIEVYGSPSGNSAPTAVAGADQTVAEGVTVQLDGSASSDPNGDTLTYQWTQIGGPAVTLSDITAVSPGFIAPSGLSANALLTFSLTVNDGELDSTPDTVAVNVQATPPDLIPQSGWNLLFVDSQELDTGDFKASNAFDGDPNTLWSSEWFLSDPPHPHEIQIALGGLYTVSGFRYLPPLGSSRGHIKDYEFYVSTDGSNWGTAVATGTLPYSTGEQEVLFAPTPAAFVRLVSLSATDGNNLTGVAEFKVLGDLASADLAPNGLIDTPAASDVYISVGDTIDFTATASDPENDLPLTFQWSFGAGSGVADSTLKDPGLTQFNTAGTFTVTFTVTDAIGLADPTPATRTVDVCTPPSVKLIDPLNKHIQSSTELYVHARPCLDSVIHIGWGVRFTLSETGGAVVGQFDDYSAPFETTFTGISQAEYNLAVTIIDGSGTEVGGLDTGDQAIIGIGGYHVGIGDSITLGLGDDVASDDTSLDGRNTLGGYEPILNNLLTASRGYPNAVFNEGVAGDTSVEGLSLTPSIIAAHPEAEVFLIQYGTNDAGIPLPDGLGKMPGQPGYNGTFKDNIQQIITLINNAGKKAYLAKAPYAKGTFLSRNSLIQKYNQVIDELINENGIAVNGIPFNAPDFYTFFYNHQTQYSDNLHPNGTGYQSMGNLWANQLLP